MALSVVYSVETQLAEALEVSGECILLCIKHTSLCGNADFGLAKKVASINSGTGYFFLLCGWGLLFWQPFALQYGKRVTYVVSLIAICVSWLFDVLHSTVLEHLGGRGTNVQQRRLYPSGAPTQKAKVNGSLATS